MESVGFQEECVRFPTAKIRVGQYVRISKEKIMFSKDCDHNFITEIFRITKVIDRRAVLPVRIPRFDIL